MATTEEIKELEQAPQVNVTRANAPAPEVPPGDGTTATTNGNGSGGKALISLPEIFTGDRNKADDFLQDFQLCWRLNRTHPAMKVPYDRVMLALSYMRGNTAIRNWVKHAMHQIDEMIDKRRFSPLKVDNERLWGIFQTEFETAFTNTTKVQDAEAALEHIRIQQGENIDQYIARFEDLMERAQWGERDRGTINTFRRGLHEAMQKAIFLKDPIPTTFTQWKEAARNEASRYALMKSAGMFQKREQRGGFKFTNPKAQQRWGRFTQNHNQRDQREHSKRDPNAMDVDTIQVNQLSAEDKEKCVKEGRCFQCQEQGHRSKECPHKKAFHATAKFVANAQKAHVRTSQVVDDRDTDTDDAKSVDTNATTLSKAETIRNLRALKEEERLELIDELFKDEKDF